MSDIALVQQADGSFDIALDGEDLLADDGLNTAIILSLFCDRRANPDDRLPYPNADRRGWWADAYAEALGFGGDQWGSRLWLLDRAVLDQDTLNDAQDYCAEALQWLIDDGIAKAVDVACSVMAGGNTWMQIVITITQPDGAVDPTEYSYVWKAMQNAV